MISLVIKLENMYYVENLFRHQIGFSPKFEDATHFNSMEDAVKTIKEKNLPEYCKIIQVTYVEHDIGYVEHKPL